MLRLGFGQGQGLGLGLGPTAKAATFTNTVSIQEPHDCEESITKIINSGTAWLGGVNYKTTKDWGKAVKVVKQLVLHC